ncbi:MAG: hypothetical protein IPM29_07410 [Planctomycetes bacterium]|nr:hypothetical protein [Planctomycetota bacterium]
MTHDPDRGARFATTRWSLVRRAGGEAGDARRAALRELCAAYWRPLYAWLRRDGHAPDAATDLVQGFVARVLEREDLGAPRDAVRFRSYLLGALRNFVRNERRRDGAVRRGGGLDRVEAAAGEQLLAALPGREPTPDEAFERGFALELLGRALGQLEREFVLRGRADRFAALRPLLDGRGDADGEGDYAALASALGESAGALRVAVHRARRRLGELVRAEVLQIVDDPQDVEAELLYLAVALGAPGAP